MAACAESARPIEPYEAGCKARTAVLPHAVADLRPTGNSPSRRHLTRALLLFHE